MSIVIGKVLLTPKGDYNPAFTYDPLDLVRHDHKSWVANVVTSSTPSDTNPDWQLYAEDGNGIDNINYLGLDPTDPDGLTDLYEIIFTNGSPFIYKVKNGKSGSGTGDMAARDYVNPATATGIVFNAANLIDTQNNKTADSEVLAKFGQDPNTGKPTYNGQEIGGSVKIDNRTIVEDQTSKELQVAPTITAKLSKLDSNGQLPFADVTGKPTTISGYGITDAYDKTTVDGMLDEWHKYGGVIEIHTVNVIDTDTPITFHGINNSLAYELFFDTSDGKQAKLIDSVIVGTDITYTVNTPTVGTQFKLRIIK